MFDVYSGFGGILRTLSDDMFRFDSMSMLFNILFSFLFVYNNKKFLPFNGAVPMFIIGITELQITAYLQMIQYRFHLLNVFLVDSNEMKRGNMIRKLTSNEFHRGKNKVADSSVGSSTSNINGIR